MLSTSNKTLSKFLVILMHKTKILSVIKLQYQKLYQYRRQSQIKANGIIIIFDQTKTEIGDLDALKLQ